VYNVYNTRIDGDGAAAPGGAAATQTRGWFGGWFGGGGGNGDGIGGGGSFYQRSLLKLSPCNECPAASWETKLA
jgi:hypothetical protein